MARKHLARVVAVLLVVGCGASDLEHQNDELVHRIQQLELENDILRGELRTSGDQSSPELQGEAVRTPPSEEGVITVTIASDGTAHVNSGEVDMMRLADLAREAGGNARAVIAADSGAPYRRVVEVMDVLRSSGVSRISLAVESN